MELKERYALITGASSGLGKEMALQLAKRKINLLLTSLPGEKLDTFCKEVSAEYGIKSDYIEVDLVDSRGVYDIEKWIQKNEYRINILINNAGVGGSNRIDTVSTDYLENILGLNVRAVAMLTKLLLEELKSHTESYILNVASMASFSPMAYKTVYPATKAFVYSFSRGLYMELKGTGVFVSSLHPGPMPTNPDVSERIVQQGIMGKIFAVDTEKVAQYAIKKLFKRKQVIIPGLINKINWTLIQIVPLWIRLPATSKVMEKDILKEEQAKG